MKLLSLLLLSLALALGCAAGEKDAEEPTADDLDDDDGDDDGDDDTEDTEDTEEEPTTGPGVLGDESGLEASCRRYVECGGTWYEDQEACMQASYDYWGDCPEVVDALDALGECIAWVDCSEYNPDSYHPSSIGCDEEWEDLGAAECR